MIALTCRASKSLDPQIIPVTTFMFSDSKSGVTVSELAATARTSWSFFTAHDEKHLSSHCVQAYTLL